MQPELADLDVVAVDQGLLVRSRAVDVGAVQRSGVGDHEGAGGTAELRMPTRHGDVVQEDVGIGVAPHGDDFLVEQELGADVGPADADQQGRARGQVTADPLHVHAVVAQVAEIG